MGSGSVRAHSVSHRALAGLVLATSLLAPTASAHGLLSLDLVVDDCPEGPACLTTREAQPVLHAGETVDVNVYNDASEEHRLHVTRLAHADTESRSTPVDEALVSSHRLSANASEAAGELAIPAGAEALYAWCSIDDHEDRGEHHVIELELPHEPDDAPVPAAALSALLMAAAAALGLGRR